MKHSRIALGVTTILAVALALVPAAFAGKGTGGSGGTSSSTSSLSVVMVNDVNGNGAPNYGDSVTFSVSTTATANPYVTLGCVQGSTAVYQSSYMVGFFPGYPWPWLRVFALSSQTWTGGAATCTAKLEYNTGHKWVVLASTTFAVAA